MEPHRPDEAAMVDTKLVALLDEYGLERVWAWGHPNGLRSGTDRAAARDLVAHLAHARAIGASVMRIVGGSWRTRPASYALHKRRLAGMLKKLLPAAQDHGVVMAIENHIDLTADQMVDLIATIDSPWLGVCLDTGNNLRLHEDPLVVAAMQNKFGESLLGLGEPGKAIVPHQGVSPRIAEKDDLLVFQLHSAARAAAA